MVLKLLVLTASKKKINKKMDEIFISCTKAVVKKFHTLSLLISLFYNPSTHCHFGAQCSE